MSPLVCWHGAALSVYCGCVAVSVSLWVGVTMGCVAVGVSLWGVSLWVCHCGCVTVEVCHCDSV